jgi:hypothetical protein
MMADRNSSPCLGCTERFTACSDRCPKDSRGEYGYNAWKADYKKMKDAEKEYKRRSREDFIRSEQCEVAKQNYIKSKSGKIYRR